MKYSDLLEKFEVFLSKEYYDKILKAVQEQKPLIVSFVQLEKFDSELSDYFLESPEESLRAMQESLSNVYAGEEVEKINIRISELPETEIVKIKDIRSNHIGKFIGIEGIIKQASEVRPEITIATFECQGCGERVTLLQDKQQLSKPFKCMSCGNKRGFDLITRKLIDIQRIVVEESPETLEGGAQPRKLAVFLSDDLVDPKFQKKVVPGNKVRIDGIINDIPLKLERGGESKRRDIYMNGNYLETIEKEFEEIEIGDEDIRKIKILAKNPRIYELLTNSIAPSIYGYKKLKEAIALQLFGGIRKVRPDGITIRGDIHVFLVGDPGCLIGDERIVLGNGAIMKMEQFGKSHLEDINTQVLIGSGKKRDIANCFHKYESQPIIEVITESGKCIKGTYNHPLLVIGKKNNRLIRRWKRLDELKRGDRLAVVTGIPCTIKDYIKTGFKEVPKRYGPRFKGRLPKTLTPELASILGYFIGDGWATNYRVGFTVANPEIDLLPKIKRMIKKVFDVEPKIYKIRRKERKVWLYEGSINRKDIAQNLAFLRIKRVPDIILKSGNKVVSTFLKWLFEADGCVFCKGRGRSAIQLKSKNIELLRDVQMLLLRFGIHSRIIENNLTIRRGESILKYVRKIGFVSKKKCKRLRKLEKRAGLTKRFKGQRSERIVSIKKAGLADVYDIEVPLSHRFIANGIISHNTAKSQLLKYVAGLAPKARYVVGKSASGAGITATVVKDEFMRGWALEAGALVLANKGIVMIDELDKMGSEDRSAMHEVMEQQTVTISKANVQATLLAQTTILAAANPKFGRFDPYASLAGQIDIPNTLLSRFDLIFTIRDLPNKESDTRLAKHILKSHEGTEEVKGDILDGDLLRKYIAYTKANVKPKLTKFAKKEIEHFFVDLRNKYSGEEVPTVPLSARQLESLVRLATASAKIRLSNKITREDAKRAIEILVSCLKEVGVDIETGRFDIDRIESGITATQRNKIRMILDLVSALQAEAKDRTASIDDVLAAAEEEGITDAEEVIKKLKREGELFEPKTGFIRRV